MLLPRVKKIEENENWFKNDWVFPECNDGNNARKLLKMFSPKLKTGLGADATISLNVVDFTNIGEYKISVTEDCITINYCDYEGLRNAVATISGLEVQGKIKCVEISDYPENQFRSCLLDLARGYVEINVLKEHLVRLAKLKFNYVHLHLMDRQTYILESDVVPNPDNHKQYTKKELKDIVAFCKMLALDAIPEIEFPAHAVNILKAIPELSCDIIDMDKARKSVEEAKNEIKKEEFIDKQNRISRWCVCLGKESTYKIYENIIDEIVEIFDSQYIHIGGDEIEYINLAAIPHWDNCHQCKKLMEKYNNDILSIYHHGIRRINEIIKAKGKKTIKWNESREGIHAVDLPTDIIFEYWVIDNLDQTRSPIERYIDLGFTLINAQCDYTYVDLQTYMTAEKISNWNPYENKNQKKAVWGGEMCAWELGNKEYSYYNYTLPICMALFSDRVWNSDVIAYDDEYTRSLFSAVIGQNSLEINPLGIFEDIIPPRNKEILQELKWDTINPAEILEILSKLNGIDENACYGKIALTHFKKYLTELHTAIIKNNM